MITILHASLQEVQDASGPEAILRSVTSGLEADTPFSREVEVRAGSEVAERLQALGDLPLGAAVITPAGDLSTSFLIHVVLQSAEEGVTQAILRLALTNGLRRAGEWGVESLVVPPLGTGAGNMDAQESAAVMVPLLMRHDLDGIEPSHVLVLAGTEYEREVFSGALDAARNRRSAQGS